MFWVGVPDDRKIKGGKMTSSSTTHTTQGFGEIHTSTCARAAVDCNHVCTAGDCDGGLRVDEVYVLKGMIIMISVNSLSWHMEGVTKKEMYRRMTITSSCLCTAHMMLSH